MAHLEQSKVPATYNLMPKFQRNRRLIIGLQRASGPGSSIINYYPFAVGKQIKQDTSPVVEIQLIQNDQSAFEDAQSVFQDAQSEFKDAQSEFKAAQSKFKDAQRKLDTVNKNSTIA